MHDYTDTELLDFLQQLNDQHRHTGNVILRISPDRGWRLHETSESTAQSNVRQAIIDFINDKQ